MLGRLRIWGKLTLLSVIPLVALVALTIPITTGRLDRDARANAMSSAVDRAAKIGSLAQDLQRERLLSVGFLLGVVKKNDVLGHVSTATDRLIDTRAELGSDTPTGLRTVLDGLKSLTDLRASVLAKEVSAEQAVRAYGTAITSLLEALRLTEDLDVGSAEGRQVLALEALLTADDAISAEVTTLTIVAHHRSDEAIAMVNVHHATAENALRRVSAMATPAQLSLREIVDRAFVNRFGDQARVDPLSTIGKTPVETLFLAVESFITLGNFVEKRITADVTVAVDERRANAMVATIVICGLAILVVLIVLVLGFAIASSVARPLTRLTASAERVAGLTEQELIRVDDTESEAVEPIRLDPTDVTGQDEIGDLARAFDKVQSTASRLVERQVVSRRNIAEMFGHIGRRTHNLVSRQVGLIDSLERQETDSNRLRDLYTLDHLSNRLRRNATSLFVLSGADQVDEYIMPVSLSDVIRLALAEIEGYERVDVLVSADPVLAPATVSDLTLVTAELLENATTFSPPHTRVTATVERTANGARLTIVDHGLGMPAERMSEENARIRRRERLDLVPTRVLGLFVVGRLARRHRLAVVLMPTAGGGVTVTVDLGVHLLADIGGTRSDDSATPQLRPVGGTGASVLRRADDLIAVAKSWNAFAIPAARTDLPEIVAAPAPATAPNPPAAGSRVSAAAPNRHRGMPGAGQFVPPVPVVTPVPAVPRASAVPPITPPPTALPPITPPPVSVTFVSDAPRTSTSGVPGRAPGGHPGLRRRVPGANLITERISTQVAEAPTEMDASDARALVEMFESGVTKALSDFDANP